MDKKLTSKLHFTAAFSLMLVLVLSLGASAFAAPGSFQGAGAPALLDHHKEGHEGGPDNGNGNGNGKSNGPPGNDDKEKGNPHDDKGKGPGADKFSMLRPVPTSLENFKLSADGMAISERDGRDGPLVDAEVDLRASVLRNEGNHFRFLASGTVDIDGDEYDIVDAQGIIIFFKNLRGHSVSGLLHIVGKHAFDEDGSDLGKFRLRALVLGTTEENTWKLVVFPAGRLGQNIMLVNMDGTITGLSGNVPQPPSPGSGALHHFDVSTIPSSVAAGSGISVTVTARMSNGTLLKSYEEKAKISDSTGSVTPVITPRFVDGVFTGILNITKAATADKVKFTDIDSGKSGESNSFAVTAGSLLKVDLSPNSASLGPNGKAEFTAKGLDKFGNELTGLTFSWALSSSSYGAISTAGNKAEFTAASSISGSVKVNITASASGKSDMSQISLSPGSSQVLDHFVIGNVTSPQTAGVPFQMTVRAVNSTGATITGYGGPITITDTTGSLNMTVSSGFASGVWTGNVNITEADDDVKITARDAASPSKKGTSNEFDVVPGALHHFDFNPVANQTAGVQFSVVVRAEDAFGNLKEDFVGNVTLSTNNGASPAGNTTLFVGNPHNFTAADNGQHTFVLTMYNAKQDTTITATGAGKTGTSNEFDVLPGAAAKVTVSPTSATVSPGGKATFSAVVKDAFGNDVTGADIEWSVAAGSLGDIEEKSSTSAEFTASSGISSTTSGTVTAEVGSVSGTASITVQV